MNPPRVCSSPPRFVATEPFSAGVAINEKYF